MLNKEGASDLEAELVHLRGHTTKWLVTQPGTVGEKVLRLLATREPRFQSDKHPRALMPWRRVGEMSIAEGWIRNNNFYVPVLFCIGISPEKVNAYHIRQHQQVRRHKVGKDHTKVKPGLCDASLRDAGQHAVGYFYLGQTYPI